jgi:MarC family membrane protein
MYPLLKSTVLIISALFPIVNPLGSAPLFLSMTRDYSEEDRKLLSTRIAINGFFLLIASYLTGTHILSFFGISIPVVQVGGGLVLASTGWAMLEQKSHEDETKEGVNGTVDRRGLFEKAFYSLTLPLTVGPGSISVAITLGANEPHGSPDFAVDHRRGDRFVGDIGQRVPLLRIRGRTGTGTGLQGDECDHAAVVVSAGVYRRADYLERGIGAVEDYSGAVTLTTGSAEK